MRARDPQGWRIYQSFLSHCEARRRGQAELWAYLEEHGVEFVRCCHLHSSNITRILVAETLASWGQSGAARTSTAPSGSCWSTGEL